MPSSLKVGLLASALLLAGHALPAQAATLSPGAMAPGAASAPLAEPVHWVCGPYHCVWRPNYRGPIPAYTLKWGPPRAKGCMWVRGPFYVWRHVCP